MSFYGHRLKQCFIHKSDISLPSLLACRDYNYTHHSEGELPYEECFSPGLIIRDKVRSFTP